MRYKEAAQQVRDLSDDKEVRHQRLRKLYHGEALKRVGLRSQGKSVINVSLVDGVLKEMDEWIVKAVVAAGFTEEEAETLRSAERHRLEVSRDLAVRFHGLDREHVNAAS